MDELSLDEIQRVVGGIVHGEPAPPDDAWRPLPWIGWLAVALVRYRAQQRSVIGRLGDAPLRRDGGTIQGMAWSYSAVTPPDYMEVVVDDLRMVCRVSSIDDDRAHTVDASRDAAGEPRFEQVTIEPAWLSALSFARAAEEDRYASAIAGRLTALLRGGIAIAHIAGWLIDRLGGSRAGPEWLQLPPALEALAGELDPRFDAQPGAELDRVAAWLGDLQLIGPDPEHMARLRARHRKLIDRRLARGESAVAEALPAMVVDGELTDPTDELLARYRESPRVFATLLDVLRRTPRAPPSRFLAELVRDLDPVRDAGAFQIAVPYLLERGVEPELVRGHLRGLSGQEPAAAALARQVISPAMVLELLVLEPELARGLVHHALVHEHLVTVREIAALLVAIAAPWCITVLRSAQSTATHHVLVLRALAHLGAGPTTSAAAGPYRELFASTFAATPAEPASRNSLAAAIDNWERTLELMTPQRREQLARGPARSGRPSQPP